MSDSIEMNYYEPETTTWTVNLDGRYMSVGSGTSSTLVVGFMFD